MCAVDRRPGQDGLQQGIAAGGLGDVGITAACTALGRSPGCRFRRSRISSKKTSVSRMTRAWPRSSLVPNSACTLARLTPTAVAVAPIRTADQPPVQDHLARRVQR